MSPRSTIPQVTNPWNEYGVSSYPPRTPMVGQEQVHRHLEAALRNFQPTEGSSAWFYALTSTWGGGKTRTADELVSEVTGESRGWIDRTGAQLAPLLQPDFADGILPLMVSYKWVIRQTEDAGRRLPFTEWIPRVTLAALMALRDRAKPQLRAILEHLETFNAPVARAVRDLPSFKDVTAFVAQRRDSHPPTLVEGTKQVVPRHPYLLKKHLVKLCITGHLHQRPDGNARAFHMHWPVGAVFLLLPILAHSHRTCIHRAPIDIDCKTATISHHITPVVPGRCKQDGWPADH
jgi:hypothetical protein